MLNKFSKNKVKTDEEKSYAGIFLISVIILTGVTAWMFLDEFVTRRAWKQYQLESDNIEYKSYSKKYNEESKKVAGLKIKLNDEIKKVKEELKGNAEYKDAIFRLNSINTKLEDIELNYKFAKSRLDEAYYWYKHALHEGHDVEDKKKILDDLNIKLNSYLPGIEKNTKVKIEIENQIKGILKKEKDLKNKLQKATSKINLYKSNMDSIKKKFLVFDVNRIPEVKQTVVTGLDLNNFKEPMMRVDRCESCHTLINKEGYEKEKHPFRTHPDRELFLGKHDTAKFGCSVCHMGQGVAISTAEKAHGEFHHENDITSGLFEPLYKKEMMTASCRKCHDDEFEIEGGGLLSKGKLIFIKLGCHGCHKVKGYDTLRKVGPVLKRIGSKTDPNWLFKWIKDPKKYLPDTRMPFFDLSDEDATAITAYLIANSEKTYQPDNKFIKGIGSVEDGKKIFETVGCLGCHSIDSKGGKFAPNLSNISSKVDPDWLISWMKNPKQYNPKTIMPSFRLTEYEAESITAYLLTKGKKETVPGLADKIKQKEIIQKGARLIRKRGCFACHEIPGMENEQRIAPELTTFGNKPLTKLEFGDAEIGHSWDSWARNKLKNPSVFRTERVLDKMPNFALSEGEIDALVVLLKSFRGFVVPNKFKRNLTSDEEAIEKGRMLVWEFNCFGCHIIEDKGGFISRYYKTPSEAPPLLESGNLHEGEKVQGAWLFAFLKKPSVIRPWLKVRMPTFYFTDEEVTTITRYFGALAKAESLYDYIEQRDIPPANLVAAKKLMSRDYFDCFECHSFGDVIKPTGSEKKRAPDLANVRKRLRPEWIIKWLKNPSGMVPRTRMPNFFDDEDDIPEDVLNGELEKQIKALRDFLIYSKG